MRVSSLRDSLAFVRHPAAFTVSRGYDLGDFYRLRLPGSRIHVVTDPELAEQILVRHGASFEKSRIYWRELRRSFGDSMGSMEGERWEYLHRVERPFFTPKAVNEHLATAARITTLHFDRLAEGLEGTGAVAVLDAFSELNARIVLSVLFGESEGTSWLEHAQRIADGHAIIAWRDQFPWRPLLGWLTGVNRRAEGHKHFFAEHAERVRRAGEASNGRNPRRLLHALLEVHSDREAPAFPDSLLRNEMTFHLGASTETQAAAESWAVYLLWKSPRVIELMRQEIADVAGTSPINEKHVGHLTYTRQVIQETLRLYPPVHAIVRDCVEPVALNGHRASKGETFLISVYGMHRSPRLWAESDGFRPDRFHRANVDSIRKYSYLPFGAGKHVCIGQHMALPLMELALAQFVQRFDWTFDNADIAPVAKPSLKPASPFLAAVALRREHVTGVRL